MPHADGICNANQNNLSFSRGTLECHCWSTFRGQCFNDIIVDVILDICFGSSSACVCIINRRLVWLGLIAAHYTWDTCLYIHIGLTISTQFLIFHLCVCILILHCCKWFLNVNRAIYTYVRLAGMVLILIWPITVCITKGIILIKRWVRVISITCYELVSGIVIYPRYACTLG